MFATRHPARRVAGRRVAGRRGLVAVAAGIVLAWTAIPAATRADAPVEVADRMALREALVAAHAAAPRHPMRFRVEKRGDPEAQPFEVEVFQEGWLVGIVQDHAPGSGAASDAAPWRRGPFQAVDADTSVIVSEEQVALRSFGPAALHRAAAPFAAARTAVARRCGIQIAPAPPASPHLIVVLELSPLAEAGRFYWYVGWRAVEDPPPPWLTVATFRDADGVRATDVDVTVARGALETTLRRADGSVGGLRCTHPRDPTRVAVVTRVAPTMSVAAWRAAIAAAVRLPDAPDAPDTPDTPDGPRLRVQALEVFREAGFGRLWSAVAGERSLRLRALGPCRTVIVEELARALMAYGGDEPTLPREPADLEAIVDRTIRRDTHLSGAPQTSLREAFARAIREAGEAAPGPGPSAK